MINVYCSYKCITWQTSFKLNDVSRAKTDISNQIIAYNYYSCTPDWLDTTIPSPALCYSLTSSLLCILASVAHRHAIHVVIEPWELILMAFIFIESVSVRNCILPVHHTS